MIDPLIVTDKDIQTFTKKFGLKKIKNKDSNVYFLRRDLLQYFLNTTESEIAKILNFKNPSYVVVTGFGLTGDMHLGGRLLLNECTFFASKGITVCIFLSKADYFSKQIKTLKLLKIQNKISSFIENLNKYKTIKIKDDNIGRNLIKELQDNILEKDFRKAYGDFPEEELRVAVISMIGSVYSAHKKYCKEKRIVVLLGVDEICHGVFITLIFKKLKLPLPIFLFNNLIIGYDGKKMGKTRSQNSLVVSNSFASEYKKIKPHIEKIHSHLYCPATEIIRFSEYSFEEIGTCSDKNHNDVKNIIKQECSK